MADISIVCDEDDHSFYVRLDQALREYGWWADFNSDRPEAVAIIVLSKALSDRVLSAIGSRAEGAVIVQIDDLHLMGINLPPAVTRAVIPLSQLRDADWTEFKKDKHFKLLILRLRPLVAQARKEREAKERQAELKRKEEEKRERLRREEQEKIAALLRMRRETPAQSAILPSSASRNERDVLWQQIERDHSSERIVHASMSDAEYERWIGRGRPVLTVKENPHFVDISAFGPKAVAAGDQVLIQVLLHLAEHSHIAAAFATESDPETQRRGKATLASEIKRGQRIDIFLDAPGLAVPDSSKTIIWDERIATCQFLAAVPADSKKSTYHLTVRVSIEEMPIGTIIFSLPVSGTSAQMQEGIELKGDVAKRYRYAFLSYTKSDRAEVLRVAQTLNALHIDFFQDLLSVEPGTLWEKKIWEEIDRSDLFLLFWSASAAKSQWVISEAQYALKRRKQSPEQLPDIKPMILEVPAPSPPEELKEIHLNDSVAYVIAAVKAEEDMIRPAVAAALKSGQEDEISSRAKVGKPFRFFRWWK
jgi:hypothetical protein